MSAATAVFERAIESRAQLLRVDRGASADAVSRESLAPEWLLTFDVGRVRVRPDPASGSVASEHTGAREALVEAPADAMEEEPWWRVLGHPVTRVWEDAGGRGLCLQFRPDEDNPRVIRLEAEGALVRATLLARGPGSQEMSP